jgi:hypothetical protein
MAVSAFKTRPGLQPRVVAFAVGLELEDGKGHGFSVVGVRSLGGTAWYVVDGLEVECVTSAPPLPTGYRSQRDLAIVKIKDLCA